MFKKVKVKVGRYIIIRQNILAFPLFRIHIVYPAYDHFECTTTIDSKRSKRICSHSNKAFIIVWFSFKVHTLTLNLMKLKSMVFIRFEYRLKDIYIVILEILQVGIRLSFFLWS